MQQTLLASLALVCIASLCEAFLPLPTFSRVANVQVTRQTCLPKLRMSGKVAEQVKIDLTSYSKEEFLRKMMSSRTPAAEKKDLLDSLRRLRETNEADYMGFLKELLQEIDGVKDQQFAMTRWPVPLPSYRTKLGCLRRMMSRMNEESQSTNERSLAVILRQLMDKGAWFLEQEAIERSGKEASMEEMLSRTPEGLETPSYDVLASRSTWEVRQYEEFTVCSTNMSPAEGFRGFNALANYIFGGNQESKKMAMTTPVINSQNGAKMSFVMPSSFWKDTSQAPKPNPESGVVLEGQGGGFMKESPMMAVMWFGGIANKDKVEKMRAALKEKVKEDGEWELVDEQETPVLMQYNDPFQPPWKRSEFCKEEEDREGGGKKLKEDDEKRGGEGGGGSRRRYLEDQGDSFAGNEVAAAVRRKVKVEVEAAAV